MTREEHLAYCKICLNRKIDTKQGLICTLTGTIADFEETCKDFKEDPIKKQKLATIPTYQEVESVKKLNSGAQWFILIFGLSAINTLILFFGGGVSFIFGLGITRFIEGIFIGIYGELNIIGLLVSILVSGVFVLVWYFAKRLSKPAFIIGMLIYGIDALLLLLFRDWLSVGVHLYALFMIFRGFQSVDKIIKSNKFVNLGDENSNN